VDGDDGALTELVALHSTLSDDLSRNHRHLADTLASHTESWLRVWWDVEDDRKYVRDNTADAETIITRQEMERTRGEIAAVEVELRSLELRIGIHLGKVVTAHAPG
jgi:hypothetical protein